jgi:DUF4097 and DUF4098 domain-containing protein YvlB
MPAANRTIVLSLTWLGLLPACSEPNAANLVIVQSPDLKGSATREDKIALDLRDGEALDLLTKYGQVQVVTGKEQPYLTAALRLHARTDEEAALFLRNFKLASAHASSGLQLRLEGEPVDIGVKGMQVKVQPTVSFTAVVPAGTALCVRTGTGDVGATGPFGSCDLESGYGKITLDQAKGRVNVKSGTGDVLVKAVTADQASVHSGYGAIRVEDLQCQDLRVESRSGAVTARNLAGKELRLTSGYGDITAVQGTGRLVAESRSGAVSVQDWTGALDVRSDYGKVSALGTFTSLAADSKSGAVEVTARPGSKLDQAWSLHSGYGDLLLVLPDGFACAVEASTGHGEIQTDFPLQMEAGKVKPQQLRGAIGQGGGNVRLDTASGNIAIRKAR